MLMKGHTIVVTGGTSGIGKSLVKLLAPSNTSIIVIGRNPIKLEELKQDYDNVVTYECDLANKMEVERIIGEIAEQHPDVSVVINNAGIQMVPTFLDDEFCFDCIEKEITVNLTSPIWVSALIIGHFITKKKPTAIVNITSGLAIYPKTSSAVYCATKAALRNFSMSLRYQLENTQVSVHEAILPLVDTPMTEGRGRNKLTADQAAHAIINGVNAGINEIYIGKSKFIPMLSRLSPSLMRRILKSA